MNVLIFLMQNDNWFYQLGLPILTLLLGGGVATALVTAIFNYKGKRVEVDANAENQMRADLWQEVHKLRAMLTEVNVSEAVWQEKYWKLREEVSQLPAKIQELGVRQNEIQELRRRLEECQERVSSVEQNEYFKGSKGYTGGE